MEEKNTKKHEWVDGEHCWKCGDKDWFASPVCSESKVSKNYWDKKDAAQR